MRISGTGATLVAEVISNASREVIAVVGVTRPGDQVFQISGPPAHPVGARSYFWTSNFHGGSLGSLQRGTTRSAGRRQGLAQDTASPRQGWLRLEVAGDVRHSGTSRRPSP